MPYFTEALVTGLSYPDDSHFTDAGLKMAVLKGKFETIFVLKLFGLIKIGKVMLNLHSTYYTKTLPVPDF